MLMLGGNQLSSSKYEELLGILIDQFQQILLKNTTIIVIHEIW